MNILIICGERSSNKYGLELAKELNQHNHHVYSFGDDVISTETTCLLPIDSTQHSVSFGQWFKKRTLIKQMKHTLTNSNIHFDKAIIIDFPGFNFIVATLLRRMSIPILTFITPNFWLWNNTRLAKKVLNYSDDVITIFKPEYDLYASINPKKTHYFGHPLPLNITPFDSAKKNTFTVGLFPGSRKSEINHHLPAMLTIKNQANQSNIEFKLFCETPKLIPQIKAILLHNNCSEVPVYANLDEPLDFAITAPGTNTLKLALHKIPMIIIGYLNIWVYLIAKHVLRIKVNFIGLPNIILNKAAFSEYIQPNKKDVKTISNQLIQLSQSNSNLDQFDQVFDDLHDAIKPANHFYSQITRLI